MGVHVNTALGGGALGSKISWRCWHGRKVLGLKRGGCEVTWKSAIDTLTQPWDVQKVAGLGWKDGGLGGVPWRLNPLGFSSPFRGPDFCDSGDSRDSRDSCGSSGCCSSCCDSRDSCHYRDSGDFCHSDDSHGSCDFSNDSGGVWTGPRGDSFHHADCAVDRRFSGMAYCGRRKLNNISHSM